MSIENLVYTEITSGSSKARILHKGAYLYDLSIASYSILKKTQDDSMTHGGCAVLVPFAGRIRKGEYTWEGKKYTLPKNKEGNAIHGFLKDKDLEVKKNTEDSIELEGLLDSPGYPSKLQANLEYKISKNGFSADCKVSNVGDSACPLYAGFHPYFLAQNWQIRHDCDIDKLEMKDDFFPTGRVEKFDFNKKSYSSETNFDTCFYFPCDLSLQTKSYGLKITKKNMPYLVVYDGKWAEEKSVAMEPYSAPPDAFNNLIALTVLSPGEIFSCGFNLEVL